MRRARRAGPAAPSAAKVAESTAMAAPGLCAYGAPMSDGTIIAARDVLVDARSADAASKTVRGTLPRDHVDIVLRGDVERRRAEIVAKCGEADVFY